MKITSNLEEVAALSHVVTQPEFCFGSSEAWDMFRPKVISGYATSFKGPITSKIKHAIKHKTSRARLAQLLQLSLAFCFNWLLATNIYFYTAELAIGRVHPLVWLGWVGLDQRRWGALHPIHVYWWCIQTEYFIVYTSALKSDFDAT